MRVAKKKEWRNAQSWHVNSRERACPSLWFPSRPSSPSHSLSFSPSLSCCTHSHVWFTHTCQIKARVPIIHHWLTVKITPELYENDMIYNFSLQAIFLIKSVDLKKHWKKFWSFIALKKVHFANYNFRFVFIGINLRAMEFFWCKNFST